MGRKVTHFSLHRVGSTELRVVSDVEAGVLPMIQEEEEVIRRYVRQGSWPHQCVTLFILQDLQPLVHQVQPSADMFPGGTDVLSKRPVVNVYDLAEPTSCQVFINREVMAREGYWDDPTAVRGLLAHEHAHPLSEGKTTLSSRGLGVELAVEYLAADISRIRQSVINNILNLLAHKLCIYAPREVFANETMVRSGFGDALLHLDRRNVTSAQAGLAGRESLQKRFQHSVEQGELTQAEAGLLLLVGDLQNYTDLALEVAPFYRSGRESDARELETALKDDLFPYLEPEVRQAYTALIEQYVVLSPDLTPDALSAWCRGTFNIFAEILSAKGLRVNLEFKHVGN